MLCFFFVSDLKIVYYNFICSLSHHQTSTAQGLFKMGLDAGPQLTYVQQNPKIPSALSAPPPSTRAPQVPGNKQQTIVVMQNIFSSLVQGIVIKD